MALHRIGISQRPALYHAPREAGGNGYIGKDIALPDAYGARENASSDTDRLLQQSQDLLALLRRAVASLEE